MLFTVLKEHKGIKRNTGKDQYPAYGDNSGLILLHGSFLTR